MKKGEFLEKLSEALYEVMDENAASVHIEYYRNYINHEIQTGKTEEQVIEELGNPRLIVKSIIDAGDDAYKYSNDVTGDSYKSGHSYRSSNEREKKHMEFSFNGRRMDGVKSKVTFWVIIALLLLVFVAIIGSIFGIVVFFAKMIIKFIVPIAIVIAILMIIRILGNDK